ncbi:MAG: efflux RND transporter periplasmic adaptor subunit, partial [Bacteroidota bacterium]|nr:efflux RND transporter periplasmic adaptor subunit [Bacteroidota bacterium]
MNKRTKYLLISAAVLFVILIIAKRAGWIGKSSAIEVQTTLVESHDIVELVTASGRLQPETEVKISAD